MSNKFNNLIFYIENKRWHKLALASLALFLMVVVTLIVYQKGGVWYVLSHMLYVPVVIFAFLWGVKAGIVAGLLAGVLMGPIMPPDALGDEVRTFWNWFIRLIFFTGVGGTVGFLFSYLRRLYAISEHRATHFGDTGIPNARKILKENTKHETFDSRVGMTLQINNYEPLVVLLGSGGYVKVLKELHRELCDLLPETANVVQVDYRKFWIDMSLKAYKQISRNLTDTLELHTYYDQDIPLFLDLTVGVSLPSVPKTMVQRFNESDLAALNAKNNNLKFVVFHKEHQKDKLLIRRLGELPHALSDGQMFLMYQPLIDLNDDKHIGLEALIRWKRDGKVLEPCEFIPLAEETRVIDALTEWVLDEALKDFSVFTKIRPDLTLAINISQRNLFNPDLIDRLKQTVIAHKLPAGALELEMTESTMMQSRALTRSFLESFRKLGVKSVLDDFGTGYSSLSCLRDLPVDKVKIDREFTKNIYENATTRMTVKTIINLAHHIGLTVVAEGIEDEKTLDVLKELGCDYAQGFLFSKPLEYEAACRWIKN